MNENNLIISESELSKRDARSLIFHFLYAAESYDYLESLDAIVNNFNEGFSLSIPVTGAIVQTAHQIIQERDRLDAIYVPLLENWRLDRVSVCSKLTIRFGTWELISTDTPTHIIINEAIELAKSFAEVDAYRLVNGILDRVAHQVRKNAELLQPSD